MDGGGLQTWQIIVAATNNVALSAMVGSLWASSVLATGESAWSRSRADSMEAILRASTAVAVGAAILGLWILVALITELPLLESAGSIGKILVQTHAGRAWAVGATALGALLLLLRARSGKFPEHRTRVCGAACIVVFAGSRSWVSHAGASGDLLAFAIDWAHLMSVSAWAGMVGISATIALRDPLPQYFSERSECAHFVESLSRSATWCLAILALTGVFSSWRSLGGSPAPLVTSSYGTILLVKLAFVAVAVLMGAYNRLRVMPALLSMLRARNKTFRDPYRRFERILTSESRVLLVVLLTASLLSMSPLP